MIKKEVVYWFGLAHLLKWENKNINEIIIKFHHDNKITIEEFFHLNENIWREHYKLKEEQILDLKHVKSNLASYAFLGQSLLSQGYEIIPITSPEYSKKLKDNLKTNYAPALLYIKGNKKILEEKSIAIVGSRNASEIALRFTDNIAKLSSTNEFKVIVSGYAKGVDRQALDSAIKYNLQSIIVLPQGIMTFTSGFKNYYKQIVNGDVLVLSTFFPLAPWKVELAMARNRIIYGLSDKIYVAETDKKGGTWYGAIDGLKKGRKVFVRNPEPHEKNANTLLIKKGAIPVDFNGVELTQTNNSTINEKSSIIEEPKENNFLKSKIRSILSNKKPLSAKKILVKLKKDFKEEDLINFLKKLDFIEIVKDEKTNQFLFKLKDTTEPKQGILSFN